MGPMIMLVLFIILWILVSISLPVKDMIEKRLGGKTEDPFDRTVKDEPGGKQGVQKSKIKFDEYPKSGYCDVCSRKVKPCEAYLVPVDIFYESHEYKKFLVNHPKAKTVIASKGIDTYISEMRARDKTDYSTICPDCVYMFLE
jgi:hypothetical protein